MDFTEEDWKAELKGKQINIKKREGIWRRADTRTAVQKLNEVDDRKKKAVTVIQRIRRSYKWRTTTTKIQKRQLTNYYVEHKTLEQIAKEENSSITAVHENIKRGEKNLKAAFGDLKPEELINKEEEEEEG